MRKRLGYAIRGGGTRTPDLRFWSRETNGSVKPLGGTARKAARKSRSEPKVKAPHHVAPNQPPAC
jgi:hypothetical protein